MNYLKSCSLFLIQLIIVSILCVNPVNAQEMMVAKLTEKELAVVLPIMKAEVTENKNLVDKLAEKQRSQSQLFLDIKSGKTDPLEWLKQHSKHILVPPEAKYEPACSRAVSLGISSITQEIEPDRLIPGGTPTAIFTLGKEIHSINKQILGKTITMNNYEQFMQQVYSINEQDYAAIKIVIDRAIEFYTRNGFYAKYETLEDGPSRTTAFFYHPEDEGYISGKIYHLNVTLFNPYFSETVNHCQQLPMGPSIEIKAESKLFDKVFSSGSGKTNEDIINSLRKAGISEERYALIKSSLIKARIDSENPDAIEVPEFDFTPTTEEEKETAKIINQMKTDALNRKSNVIIYNKFKTEIDPILDILQQFIY